MSYPRYSDVPRLTITIELSPADHEGIDPALSLLTHIIICFRMFIHISSIRRTYSIAP